MVPSSTYTYDGESPFSDSTLSIVQDALEFLDCLIPKTLLILMYPKDVSGALPRMLHLLSGFPLVLLYAGVVHLFSLYKTMI